MLQYFHRIHKEKRLDSGVQTTTSASIIQLNAWINSLSFTIVAYNVWAKCGGLLLASVTVTASVAVADLCGLPPSTQMI